jgi:hypothetical protein
MSKPPDRLTLQVRGKCCNCYEPIKPHEATAKYGITGAVGHADRDICIENLQKWRPTDERDR